MNSKKWKDFAEIISAAAVVISLVFVGLEIRQSNHLAASEAVFDINSAYIQQSLLVAESTDLADIFVKVFETNEQLSSAELRRLQAYGDAFLNISDAAWVSHNSGIIDDQSYRAYMFAACSSIMPMREYWNEVKNGYTAGFVEYVDSNCFIEE